MNNRWFAPVCIGLMLVMGVIAFPQMPDQVPIHWNIQGQVDNHGPRWLVVLLAPALAIVVTTLFNFLPKHDPVSSDAVNVSIMIRYRNWVVVFLLALQGIILASAIGIQVDVVRLLMIVTGMLLIMIGNEMGRLKPNAWAGVRLPWTLTDEGVWRQSNRMGGRALVVAGLLTILSSALLPRSAVIIAMLVIILVSTAFMIGYSYWVAVQKRKSVNR